MVKTHAGGLVDDGASLAGETLLEQTELGLERLLKKRKTGVGHKRRERKRGRS